MKEFIIITTVLLISIVSNAQNDTSRVEQYCQLIVTQRLLSNKVTIDLDFGEEKRFWKDTRLKSSDGNKKIFNTVIDAMNYMGIAGWIFINAYPVRTGESETYHFAFKKLFVKSDL